jgi:hypothetical protein
MYSHLHWFGAEGVSRVVALPFDLNRLLAEWAGLRAAMRRHKPDAFSRDEWAYLMAFLSPEQLEAPFRGSFGCRTGEAGPVASLARPRGAVSVWLPNNVSLLGPLTLILLTLTGNRLWLKGGSRSDDLTGAFLDFALRHVQPGVLRDWLDGQVRYDVFERGDPRHMEMVAAADVRIVFGSDEAAASIHGAATRVRSIGFSFADRQSQAWIEPAAVSDEVLGQLIRVFAIYGQAGCTSPRRVVLLGAGAEQARALRDRIVALWSSMFPLKPPAHVASANTMALQWAAAGGWDAVPVRNRHAVIAAGPIGLEPIDSPMFLPVSAASVEEAIAQLPANIQTVGHAFAPGTALEWLKVAARTRIARLVPIAGMHHFGPLWDGEHFWRQCFEEVEVGL